MFKKICDYKIVPPPSSRFSPIYLMTKNLIRDIEELSKEIDNGIILDLGCGEKPYQKIFPKCARYIGLDINNGKKADIVAHATKLPFKDQSINNICSFQVFEHINDTAFLFAEIERILKPGGKLLVSLPQSYRLHEEPHDYYRFTKYGISYLCNKYNFKLIILKANSGSWATVGASIINIFSWKRRLSKLLLPLYFVINVVFETLDNLCGEKADTLNYIFLAQKDK